MNIKEQIGIVRRLQHFKSVQLVTQQAERKNTFLEIGSIGLFTEFTDFNTYLILIIALQDDFAVNLHQLRLQIRMCIERLTKSLHQLVGIYITERINKRNVILGRVWILRPFKIDSPLILHQRIRVAWLIDRETTIRRFGKQGCYSPDSWMFHNLIHLDMDIETALEKCAQTHGSQR